MLVESFLSGLLFENVAPKHHAPYTSEKINSDFLVDGLVRQPDMPVMPHPNGPAWAMVDMWHPTMVSHVEVSSRPGQSTSPVYCTDTNYHCFTKWA